MCWRKLSPTAKKIIIAAIIISILGIIATATYFYVTQETNIKKTQEIENTISTNLNNLTTRQAAYESVVTQAVINNRRNVKIQNNDVTTSTTHSYAVPLNTNYEYSRNQHKCLNKELISAATTLDQGINLCNGCPGVQIINNSIYKCNMIVTDINPDPDVWVRKTINIPTTQANPNLVGNSILYNKYNDYTFDLNNVKPLSEPLIWLDAVNLCNRNSNCIGVAYNGGGNNSIPYKTTLGNNIESNALLMPTDNNGKYIYVKTMKKPIDDWPFTSNKLKLP
jgi:hypothetical protein